MSEIKLSLKESHSVEVKEWLALVEDRLNTKEMLLVLEDMNYELLVFGEIRTPIVDLLKKHGVTK